MKREAAAAFVTFAATFGLVPPIRHLCRRNRVLDEPGTLKIHGHPIPRLGGAAIFLGFVAGMLVAGPFYFAVHWQFFAAMSVIWIAGVVDDLRGLPPILRLGVQSLSALLLWLGGWYVSLGLPVLTQVLLLCAFVTMFVNSFNFLDGSDGLATGVSLVIAVSYLALPRAALTPLGFSAALCMAAACLGFLPFNRHVASIFLGDSGSTLLGFLAAFLGLDAANSNGAARYSVALAFAIAALPALDAVRVITRRIARRASPISGDRNHFYDALLAKGWMPQRVALLSWMIVACCGAVSVCIVRLRVSIAWLLVAFVIVWAWIGVATLSRSKKLAAECDKLGIRP